MIRAAGRPELTGADRRRLVTSGGRGTVAGSRWPDRRGHYGGGASRYSSELRMRLYTTPWQLMIDRWKSKLKAGAAAPLHDSLCMQVDKEGQGTVFYLLVQRALMMMPRVLSSMHCAALHAVQHDGEGAACTLIRHKTQPRVRFG
jgi:hypothetical protein